LSGDGIQSLKTTRREYVETASSPREYFELFKHAFGPMVATYASLSDQPERKAELDAAFLQFIARWNRAELEDQDRVRMPVRVPARHSPHARSGLNLFGISPANHSV
jgi:hypothetical protein